MVSGDGSVGRSVLLQERTYSICISWLEKEILVELFEDTPVFNLAGGAATAQGEAQSETGTNKFSDYTHQKIN